MGNLPKSAVLYTCTESNLDMINPSVILGTNSSSRLGESPFKYDTDATNLDHIPRRWYTLLLAHCKKKKYLWILQN